VRAAFAVFRPRRWSASALAFGLCVACAPVAQGPLAGSSDAWKKASEPARAPAPPAPAWEVYANAKQWPTANAAPFISRGHQPELPVDVRVSPEIRATYTGLVVDSTFPEGSVLTELSHADGGRGYAMRKERGNWRFYVLDANGGLLSSGALPLCAGCHAQAPSDGVFGLPRVGIESR
jgi:hypothetical protein